MLLRTPDAYATRIEWTGSIRFHLRGGLSVEAERVVLVTSGDFLEGEVPDYGLWLESSAGELRKLGLPDGMLPEDDDARVILALEAPDDLVEELNALGAFDDLDALMEDDRFLDAAFDVERLHARHCEPVMGGDSGVAA